MNSEKNLQRAVGGHPFVVTILLLWLCGTALRLTILAVPPVIPDIHHDIALSATGVGILGGLPVVLFAAAALPGSILIARLGANGALIIGLLLTAVGGALRGLFPEVWWLYLMTIVTGAGVAIMQPALPALVRLWAPQRIGFSTAVYTNGFLMGEIIPVLLTLPVVMPLTGHSWQLSLAAWSIPVVLIAVFASIARGWRSAVAQTGVRAQWKPDWRDPMIWHIALIFGGANAMYFGSNTFLPDYLTTHGRSDLVAAALSALNLGQLPASLLLLAVAGRLEGRIWPYIGLGFLGLAAVVTVALTASIWTVVAAGFIGFCCAGVLTLALALPPLLCAPDDVARTSAGLFTISYTLAMVMAVIAGMVWDATGIPSLAFAPLALAALPLIVLPSKIPFGRATRYRSGVGTAVS